MTNVTNTSVYESSILLAAIRMVSAATAADGTLSSEERIAQSVSNMMRRMNIIRSALLDVLFGGQSNSIPTGIFNGLTQLALRQACFEETQESNPNYFLLSEKSIKDLLAKMSYPVQAGTSPQHKQRFAYIYVSLFVDLQSEFHLRIDSILRNMDFEDVYAQLGIHSMDIITESLKDYQAEKEHKEHDGNQNYELIEEVISAYAKIYKSCLSEILRNQVGSSSGLADNAEQYEDVPGLDAFVELSEDDGFDPTDGSLPPDLLGDSEVGSSDGFEVMRQSWEDIFETVWETYQIRKVQFLRNVSVLEQAIRR